MSKPVLFVTNHAPPFRVGAFKALHEREHVVFALIGGDVRHGGGGTTDDELPFPVIRPPQRTVARIAASAATARWSPGISGRDRAPRRVRGRPRGPRPVRPVGDDLGATRARRRTRSPTCRCATSTATRTRSPPTARTSAPTSRPSIRAARCSRRRRPSTRPFWGAAATPDRRADFQVLFAGRPAPEKGFDVLRAGRRRRHAGRRAGPDARSNCATSTREATS